MRLTSKNLLLTAMTTMLADAGNMHCDYAIAQTMALTATNVLATAMVNMLAMAVTTPSQMPWHTHNRSRTPTIIEHRRECVHAHQMPLRCQLRAHSDAQPL